MRNLQWNSESAVYVHKMVGQRRRLRYVQWVGEDDLQQLRWFGDRETDSCTDSRFQHTWEWKIVSVD